MKKGQKRTKKVVMYIDGIKSTFKDVLASALANYISLDDMKKQLTQRFSPNGEHKITFKVE